MIDITDIDSNEDHSQLSALKGLVPGSLEAKKVWAQIDADAHSEQSVKAAKLLNPKATGMYMGKVLAPGAGAGQGDFQMLVDKLIWKNGYTPEVATKIAASIKNHLYGVH